MSAGRPLISRNTERVRLRQARLRRGWTQKQLGDRIGLDQAAVSNIELGRYNPSLTVADKLITLFPDLTTKDFVMQVNEQEAV